MHTNLAKLISKLNRNKFFRVISSIRLAIPVMLGLIVAVAAGTIVESLHNSEYARIAVYNTTWFNILLGLLALNVFSSMMSRYPWKVIQTGFVITHIGILILLAGSLITKVWGIDGTMQLPKNQASSTVVLPNLMIAYQNAGSPTLNSYSFEKSLFEKSTKDLIDLNNKFSHIFTVEKFVPFAEIEKNYSNRSGNNTAVGLSFSLKSQFFNVKEWLHNIDNPSMQLGPATLRLIVDEASAATPVKVERKTANVKNEFKLVDLKSGKTVRTFSFEDLKKGFQVNGLKIKLIKSYRSAVVAKNKLAESNDPAAGPNPALEILVSKNGSELREILYANIPQFSLNKEGLFGYRLQLSNDSGGTIISGHPQTSNQPTNLIEFHIRRSQPDKVRIVLKKSGKTIAEKNVTAGETFKSPWMGMEITIGSINIGAENVVEVRAVRPRPGSNLPTSAVFIKPSGNIEGFWLPQGEMKNIEVNGRSLAIVFSNQTITLPFELRLEEFHKKDYPGTETPYSYESLVTNIGTGLKTLISMNEPLQVSGYTLYQASFIANPGQDPISILSVNQDPGRFIKYFGSLILSMGIAIFTLMRSRAYQNWKRKLS